MKFYDRASELLTLEKNWKQSARQSFMTTLVGRRRVGKTSLLLNSVQNQKYLYLYVSKDSEAVLCSKFQQNAKDQLSLEIYGAVSNFSELFESLMRYGCENQFTLIIDEFQNFLNVNSAIPSHVQDIWDRYKEKSRVNLILCGSIYSMMKKIFENGSEPLYGRRDSAIKLRPFGTGTLKAILFDHNPNFTPDDLLCLFMLTGGVAKYVSLLMDAGATDKFKMFDYVFASDSPFLTEGTELLISEFGRDYGTYFSVLQLIASGFTTQSEIDGVIGKNTGAYLSNLKNDYTFIAKNIPLLSKPGVRNIRWSIEDCFLRFWFRFVYPYQDLIESGNLDKLKAYALAEYETFSGRTLEMYFHAKLMETGEYTRIGNWWDRSGKNELDVVALNEFTNQCLIAEVKRNSQKIKMSDLASKVSSLPKEFSKYEITQCSYALEDI